MEEFGLTVSDLRLSLNVSTNWKLALYRYFRNNPNILTECYNKSVDLLKTQPHARIESLTYIFNVLKHAFAQANIDGFICEPYDIRPFDLSGDFIWGRLYRVYCSGKIANVISSNMNYITKRFENFVLENNLKNLTSKKDIQYYFEEKHLGWILRYYHANLSPNIDAFYSETFKFISNVIQYKIPFYTSFFVSILKLYLQKNPQTGIHNLSCLDAKKITLLFEDGSIYDDYSKLIDYGISNDLVMKLHERKVSIAQLQSGEYNQESFDDYEQLLISDFVSII